MVIAPLSYLIVTEMQIIRDAAAFATLDRGGKIGFVPTMGALHSGHISLVKQCRAECDMVVVSIFVNPTQFNDPKDLERYPRTEKEDVALLEAAGVDFVFAPSVDEVYPEQDNRQFNFGAIEQVMEGASRPGHFNGVAQVVSRLFDIVKPDKAYFGEKDFQQLAIIRRMVEQIGSGVEIVGCPIVRGEDGLALSSRNMLLSAEQCQAAPHIYRTLAAAAQMSDVDSQQIERWAAAEINANPLLECEYVTVADPVTLQQTVPGGARHIFAAVRCGQIRLIDNIAVKK